MTALEAVLAGARRSEGGFVEVVGEPGIGKSRLIAEVRDRADDFRILHVDCEEYEASTPYLAIERLLRDALELGDAGDEETAARLTAATASAAPELVPWLPLIGVALGLELPPTIQTSELVTTVRHVRLERTASALLVRLLSGPVLLMVEDAHWLDEASAGVLRQVAARVREDRGSCA
jgi:predicted ATPase